MFTETVNIVHRPLMSSFDEQTGHLGKTAPSWLHLKRAAKGSGIGGQEYMDDQ